MDWCYILRIFTENMKNWQISDLFLDKYSKKKLKSCDIFSNLQEIYHLILSGGIRVRIP